MNLGILVLLAILLLCAAAGLYVRHILHLCVKMFHEPTDDDPGATSGQDSGT